MIKFDGLENVLGALEEIADTTDIENALKKSCALVERDAKKNAPKGTGELRNSITSKIERSGEDLQGIVYTPLLYAPYVEYGTGIYAEEQGRADVPWVYRDDKGEFHTTCGMPPQPYMRPALDMNREEIIRLIEGALFNND